MNVKNLKKNYQTRRETEDKIGICSYNIMNTKNVKNIEKNQSVIQNCFLGFNGVATEKAAML